MASQLEFRSVRHSWVTHAFNSSQSMGELCDIYEQTRSDPLTVHTVPVRGRSYLLGTISLERVGSLRPQFCPPYEPDMFRFASSDLDFNERQIYYQPFSNRVLRPSSSRFSYEILFHLPFVPNLILRHVISADTLVSDVQSWFAEQICTTVHR